MSQTFNLVDEPWIPVEKTDGSPGVASLGDVFAESQSIRRIGGEVPTQVFAIMGLLGAILRRALTDVGGSSHQRSGYGRREKAWGLDDWKDNYADPVASLGVISDYLAAFRDRFDVRHPVRPFYQVADLHTSKDEHSGLDVILADVPNGIPFFTSRIREGNAKISWAEAARWLVHVQAFDPSGIRSGAVGDPRVKGGKGYPIGPGWAAQIGGYLVERDALWDTLMVSLVPEGVGGLSFESSKDLASWERTQLSEKEEVPGGREPRGPVDLATWQSRRVRLVGDDEGVTGVILCQGDPLKPQNRLNLEPRSAWRYSDPQTKKLKSGPVFMPRELDPARSVWQGLEALLPGASPREDRVKGSNVSKFHPPALSAWLEDLIEADVLAAREIRYRAIGVKLGSNMSVIDELIDDSMLLPTFLFASGMDSARAAVVAAARVAEDLSRVFGHYAGNLAQAAGADNSEGEDARAKEQMLAAVGPEFVEWVRTVRLDSLDEDTRQWRYRLHEISRSEARFLTELVPPAAFEGRQTSRGEMSVGRAEVFFRAALRKLGIVSRAEGQKEPESEGSEPDE